MTGVPRVERLERRVGYVIRSLLRGGTEIQLAELLPALQARDWTLVVFGRDMAVADASANGQPTSQRAKLIALAHQH